MKYIQLILITIALASCSPASRGRSAAKDYCECDKEDGILNVAKCKKNVLMEHKEDFKNKEFDAAFWQQVEDWED